MARAFIVALALLVATTWSCGSKKSGTSTPDSGGVADTRDATGPGWDLGPQPDSQRPPTDATADSTPPRNDTTPPGPDVPPGQDTQRPPDLTPPNDTTLPTACGTGGTVVLGAQASFP